MKSPEFLFFHVSVARRKLSKGPRWRVVRWEHVDPSDALIHGGVPTKQKTKGPRKGEWIWTNVPLDRCIVTREELLAEMRKYEGETGNCSTCFGDGQEWAGWSAAEGTKWRPCSTCGATGKAKVAA